VEPFAVVADPGMDMATTGGEDRMVEEEEVVVEGAAPIYFGAFAALSGAVEIVRTWTHAAIHIGGCKI